MTVTTDAVEAAGASAMPGWSYPPAEWFNLAAWTVERADALFPGVPLEEVLADPDGRRELCRFDPVLFSAVYMNHHITNKYGVTSFSQMHLDWAELGRQWAGSPPAYHQWRHGIVSPRDSGKSTWWFLIIPLFALCYGHIRFVSAFADSAGQARKHLRNFKRETDTNVILRRDFPDMCTPEKRPSGAQVADHSAMVMFANGATFTADGADTKTLGLKVGPLRPEVIIVDDFESGESQYSAYQAGKRLDTLTSGIMPLNHDAYFLMVGTTTMVDSITHQMVKYAHGDRDPELEWIRDQRMQCHHHLPFVTLDDGTEVSVWPEKWATEDLQADRHTRDFKKNFECDPLAIDGTYWTLDDVRVGDVDQLTHHILSIDPAVTDKTHSDFTGLAVISYSRPAGRCLVRDVRQVKVAPGEPLRNIVLNILDTYPEIQGILVESNQGGMVWKAVLHDLPVQIVTIHQKDHKEARAGVLLGHYQRGRVYHEKRFPAYEGQMVSFPRGQNDDMIDAVAAGCAVFLQKFVKPRKVARGVHMRYI